MFSTKRRLVAGCRPGTAHLPARAPAHSAIIFPRLLMRYQSSAATATTSNRQSRQYNVPWRGSPKHRDKPSRVSLEVDLGQLESLTGMTRSRSNKQSQKSNKQSQKSSKQSQKSNRVQARTDDIIPLPNPTPLPTDDGLPDWAQSRERSKMKPVLFDKVHHAFQHLIIGGSFKAEFKSQKGKTSPQVCSVVATAGDQEWKAMAEARTRDDARNTAILLVLAEMHSQRIEGELFPMTRTMTQYMEKHAKTHHLLDVFNYAASLGTVPSVACTRAERLHPGYYQYTISLPEQNIQVAAVAKSRALAETAACLRFKKAAGKHVASSEIGDLAAQNPERLNSENAAKFLGWLANRHRLQNSAEVNKMDRDGGGGFWNAQVHFKSAGKQRSTPLIPSFSKAYAEEAANICAAVSVSQDEPVLFRQFIEELIGGKGHLLEIARPIELDISSSSQYAMRATLGIPGLSRLAQEQQDMADSQTPQVLRHRVPPLTEQQKRLLSPRLKSSYERYLHSDRMADMRRLKSELPMNQYKSQVAEIVEDNVYSIIIGATGSGKTTQVPQIILEKYYQGGRGADCNIVCTQPRRIAATSVAGRVADELGPDLKDRVGYQVRFDSRLPAQGGSVTYCTTGILLQQLQHEPDRVFDEVSHLMIDEVHERDKIIDFTLTVLKRAVTDRLARGLKVPRITLMSATLDTELFADYFKNLGTDGQKTEAPILSVPGRTFPVSEKHLDDVLSDIQGMWSGKELGPLRDRNSTSYIEMERKFAGTPSSRRPSQKQDTDVVSTINWTPKPVYDDAAASAKEDTILPAGLIATTIAHVLRTSTDGAVLVFFPGLAEIQAIEKILTTQSVLDVDISDEKKYMLFLLHSSIPDSQRTVFEKAPAGIRKVILSTNIAETSVTIPDVQYVIDTGKVRQVQYDNSTRVSWLQNSWISKSNAKQRAGRAGRVQNGHYLALYSKARHEAMPAIGVPELLRSDLQSTCLSVKATIRGVGVTDFLADAIDPPNPASVKEALTRLVDLGALTPDHASLTALGKLLSSLPVHPALGKMIVLGIMFKCLDPVLIIGAAAEERGLFIMAPDVKAQSLRSKADFAGDTDSDHLAIYNAFCQVRNSWTPNNDSLARRVAYGANVHFGAWKAIQHASQQIQDILQEAGVLKQEVPFTRDYMIGGLEWNVNSHKPHIVKAILLAGLQPNIGLKKKSSHRLVMLGDRPAAEPSNFSVLKINRHALADESLVAFTNVSKSTDGRSFSLRELSIVRPLAVALFGGTLEGGGHPDRSNILTVNRWLQLFVRCGASRRFGAGGHNQLADLRQNLDRVLKVAFEDLINGQRRGKTTSNQPERWDTRNGHIGMNRWTGASTLLTASQKAKIVSEFLAGVVKVLDGAESPAAEDFTPAPNSRDKNENSSTFPHGKRIWSGKPNPPGRDSLSIAQLIERRRARTGSFRY